MIPRTWGYKRTNKNFSPAPKQNLSNFMFFFQISSQDLSPKKSWPFAGSVFFGTPGLWWRSFGAWWSWQSETKQAETLRDFWRQVPTLWDKHVFFLNRKQNMATPQEDMQQTRFLNNLLDLIFWYCICACFGRVFLDVFLCFVHHWWVASLWLEIGMLTPSIEETTSEWRPWVEAIPFDHWDPINLHIFIGRWDKHSKLNLLTSPHDPLKCIAEK